MEKYGFIYLWRDSKHNKYYIGSHWGSEDDGYICSSHQMRKSYNRRPKDFKRRTLQIINDRTILYDIETKWLQLAEKNKDRHYNRNFIANHWSAYPENVKTLPHKISHKTKEAMQRPDVKQRYRAGLEKRDTRSSDPDVREKRRQTMKKTMAEKFPEENRKKKLTDEQRKEYYSNKAKDIWSRPGYKEKVGPKISEGLKGKKQRLGQTNSDEHRRRISESLKGKVHKRFKISIDGIIYQSSTEASIILGISGSTIGRRLKLDKYPEYKRIGII
jgi:hypothetical protein